MTKGEAELAREKRKEEERTHSASAVFSFPSKHDRINNRRQSSEALNELQSSRTPSLSFNLHLSLCRRHQPRRQPHNLTISEPTREVD
jgi:hypothetical protein